MTDDLPPGLAALEDTLTGGAPSLTRVEVAERSGVDLEQSKSLWRALGFSEVPDDELAFTAGDAEALATARQLLESGVVDAARMVSVARFMGQAMSRLAQIEVDIITERAAGRIARSDDPPQALADELERTADMLPMVQSLMLHVWNRHLAEAARRGLGAAEDSGTAHDMVVGFVDLVGFSSLSRRIAADELMSLVDRFEQGAIEVVARHGGRVIKSLGDEVLFVVPAPAAGAEIALELSVLPSEDDPPVRVGVAAGRVVPWLGDVYGEVVNIAARLTSIARPGSVLVDRVLAERLRESRAYSLKSLRARNVRGYDHLASAVLRRA